MLWLLALGTLLAFVVVFAVGSLALGSVLRRVEDDQIARRVERARLLLARQADTRRHTVQEYAWWTDTWEYIDHPRGPAAARFIRDNYVNWLPKQYGDRLIAVWALDRRPVFVWTDSTVRGAEATFERPALFDFLDRRKSVGGFVRTARGLFLVGAAVVVRTEDQEARGPWRGYVVFGIPVSDSVLAVMGTELQERIAIVPLRPGEAFPRDAAVSRDVAGRDSVETRFALADLLGGTAGVVVLSASRSFVRSLRQWLFRVFGSAVLVGLAVIGLLWYLGNLTLVRPLREIEQALLRMKQSERLSAIGSPAPAREWALFVSAFNQTVEALQASDERYHTLFEQAVDGLFLLDGESGSIVDANPAAEALTGRARAAILGHRLHEWLEPAPASESVVGTFQCRRPNGTAVTVGVVTGRVDLGPAPLLLASVRDLSERQALEAQLRQAQKMEAMGALAGGVAHDFNNLMGAVMVSTSFLRKEIGQGHPAIGSIETIEQATNRAAELTRQLLSFARHERYKTAPVVVNDVVANIERLCARTFHRAIRIAATLAPGLPPVTGDAGQLEQALLNLCINGRDAMPNGGVLSLRTHVEELDEAAVRALGGGVPGRFVVITVADTGTGMTPEVRRRLFEPFFTTKERGRGTGLGLAMVYAILRGHAGIIKVESSSGAGSQFELYLPVAADQVGALKPAAGGRPPAGVETVLIVDDEAELRRAMERSLLSLGYTVIVAENGREGVRRFREHAADIAGVLLDVVMPEMGGVEAFRHIRAIRPTVPVLVCSGYTAGSEVQEILDAGANGFLAKPFDTFELAQAVRDLLDGAGRDRASPT